MTLDKTWYVVGLECGALLDILVVSFMSRRKELPVIVCGC